MAQFASNASLVVVAIFPVDVCVIVPLGV